VIVGADSALIGPLLVAVAAPLISVVLGVAAGYLGGAVDVVVSRLADLLFATPALLVAVVIAGVTDGGYLVAVAIIAVFACAGDIRVLRGATIEQRNRAYVDAARVMGLSRFRIMYRQILPTLWPLVFALACTEFAYALGGLAALAFLGFGAPPGDTDWGRMVAENSNALFINVWSCLAPGIALALTAAAMNVLGVGFVVRLTRAALADVLDADYIAFARARGVDHRRVLLYYGVRNALIPVLSGAGVLVAVFTGGAILVETAFGLPGSGRQLVQALGQQDLALVQGTTFIVAVIIVVLNLTVDALYRVVDPRTRHGA
jgi:ABC-type dipeptide/oligopeptide/nickel transport system permease subunit